MDDTGLFKTQLRAILRAAVGHDIRIMFPMIISLDELLCARGLIARSNPNYRKKGNPTRNMCRSASW
jgi:phosphoenolpyruvate-protein kinase (PTS system EI component)